MSAEVDYDERELCNLIRVGRGTSGSSALPGAPWRSPKTTFVNHNREIRGMGEFIWSWVTWAILFC